MPTKRKQNIPGKSPRPGRNTRTAQGTGAHSGYRPSAKHSRGGYRTGLGSGARASRGAVGSTRGMRGTHTGFSTSAPSGTGLHGKQTARPNIRNASRGSVRPSVNAGGRGNAGGGPTLTRRNLVIGVAAVGGVAVVGGGISFALNSLDSGKSETPDYLSVPEDSVAASTDFTLIEDYTDCVSTSGSYTLPYGTLVWADNDSVAACLVPGDTASPLNTVRVLYLSSGNTATVLKEADGTEEGFEIFDVRCSESGLIWVECNTYTGAWRVLGAGLSSSGAGEAHRLDEGDSNWQIPSIAAVGETAFWQISPSSDGDAATERAVVRACGFTSGEAREVYSSKRAFATRITAATDGVVITPRAETTGTYYQLVKLSADDCSTVDLLTLPSSMVPDIAGYGKSGFSFGFTSIYSYGGGIANLGTYTPRSEVVPYSYNDLQWFRFARTPFCAPCWCGDWLVVKSTTALCGVNLASQSYFAIDTVSGSDDYGEHLVSSGTGNVFVGLSQVTSDSESVEDHAQVRVFKPLSDATDSTF